MTMEENTKGWLKVWGRNFSLLSEAADIPWKEFLNWGKQWPVHATEKKMLQTSDLLKTFLQRSLKRAWVQAGVSQPRRCHLSVNANVQESNQETAGQLIEQYPGSDTRTGRSELCSMLPSSGDLRAELSRPAAAAEELWMTIICCICINVIALSADSSDCNYKE